MCSFKRGFVQMGVRTNRVVYYKFDSQNAGDLKLIRTNGEFVKNRCSYKWGLTVFQIHI